MLLPNLICKVEKEKKKNIAQRKKEAEREEEAKGRARVAQRRQIVQS